VGKHRDQQTASRHRLDLKRVNAHLAAAVYPVLEGRGELSSRLKQDL
jgi:hypothetical protein